ncbi:hypothetical protein RIF23_07585 [Lipingzhangella sp. LS1_29]|uniref:Uncharacterized protein n=1 Tax=Lipingzhangella rawalii TaxID=2055835 RepID=A0ABU2H4D1_9ACTN|nr:hypothetical protein [Lipingzhangella rawalii]MDS1270153.1 hypothetical protein [Lipingzhangella rawalii]
MATQTAQSAPADSTEERVPEAFHYTPNAEQYVLQADALRRRQLRAALLYGSSRYWRRRQRVWPAVICGVVLIGVICGGIAVAGAFEAQQDINEERGRGGGPAGLFGGSEPDDSEDAGPLEPEDDGARP